MNRLVLSYSTEPEDPQTATTMKFLTGKIESTRRALSFTEKNVKTLPRYDRFEYVRGTARLPIQEFHDLTIKEVPNKVLLDRDHFFRKLGNDYWNVVLTTPKTIHLPRVSQETELFVSKIIEQNYSYLVSEFDSLKHLETESALRLATTIEEATNISKLEVDDPFQKRVIEDIQWNIIEVKRKLFEMADSKQVDQARKELLKIVDGLEYKMLALEEINRAIDNLGIVGKEALKEFKIKKLPRGRVELTWTRSG